MTVKVREYSLYVHGDGIENFTMSLPTRAKILGAQIKPQHGLLLWTLESTIPKELKNRCFRIVPKDAAFEWKNKYIHIATFLNPNTNSFYHLFEII